MKKISERMCIIFGKYILSDGLCSPSEYFKNIISLYAKVFSADPNELPG